MNERIRELAVLAEKLTEVEALFWDRDNYWREAYYSLYDKKFAELIVLECTKILADNSEFRGCVIIGKHFGVEE